jgi:hypothetical protein
MEARMNDAGDQAYKRQAFFETDGVDQLLSMVLELAAEHWVLRERLFAIEHAADKLGLNLSAAVESYEFSAAEQAALGAMRKTMIDNLMRAVNRKHRHARPVLRS